jgi:hypothetical protein
MFIFDNFINILKCIIRYLLVTVTARSKACTLFALSNAGIVGSNSIQVMDVSVHLFCVCVVLCVGSCLATGLSPVQGLLLSVLDQEIEKGVKAQQRAVEQ